MLFLLRLRWQYVQHRLLHINRLLPKGKVHLLLYHKFISSSCLPWETEDRESWAASCSRFPTSYSRFPILFDSCQIQSTFSLWQSFSFRQIQCCVQQSERPRTFADWTIENDVRAIVQSANVRGRSLCWTQHRRTLKGAHEAGRVENRRKRFGNETERFGDRTKRLRNGTLCIFVKRTLCFSFPLIYRFPRMANRLLIYHRYGKIRISVNLI